MQKFLRILILEDTPEDAELAVSALEAGGYSCTWDRVDNREDFIVRLDTGDYDLVISDYSLPTFDGISAAKLFSERRPEIPFILVSGTLGEEAAIESLKAGANDFVLKTKLFRMPHVVERALNEKAENRRVRESEEKVRLQAAALESAANAIVITNPKGYVTYANKAFEKMSGYGADEIYGKTLRTLKSGQHDKVVYEELWNTISSGNVWHGELVNRHKDGHFYVEEQTITPVTNAAGEILNFVAVKQDVTERNRIQTENALLAEQIAAERRRLKSIIDKVPGIVWEHWVEPSVEDDRIDFVSDYVEKMLGYTVEQFLATRDFWLSIVHPDDEEYVASEILTALDSGEPRPLEFRWIAQDGSPVWVSVHSALIFDQDGENIGVRGVTIDISSQKRAEAERHAISEIIESAISSANLQDFLSMVHSSIGQHVYAKNFFVMLHDPDTDIINYEFWVDKYDPVPDPTLARNDFAGYVLRSGEPLLLSEEKTREMIASGQAVHRGSPSPSWVGIPLRTSHRTVGVMVLQHYEIEDAYNDIDLKFLCTVADQIAMAIERKQAENDLSASEERYRLLFKKNPLPMWAYDIESLRFIAVNDSAVHHYGFTRDEFLSMTIEDIRPAEDIPAMLRSVGDNIPGLRASQIWRHRKKNGEIIDVEIASHSLDFDGRPARLVLAKDITETRLAEQALIRSEERYRELVENAIDMIYTHDLNGNYLSVNSVAEEITGFTKKEILGMNLSDSVAPEYLEKAREMMASKIAGKEVTAYDLEIIGKDGRRIAVEVNTRVVESDGKPVAIQGIARNITDRRFLEDQLRQSQKMEAVGLLAGGIAHDFNNLLTAISGYSELTLMKMRDDDPLRENIQEVKNAGSRAAALTNQLLAFSRKQVLKPRVHNLNSVITEIEKMLRRIIRESVELKTVLAPDLGNIKADPGQIEQVIMNLAVNARDAMPSGGSLTIETKNVDLDESYVSQHLDAKPGRFVRLTVSDTGHGMDEDTVKSAFVPFFTTKKVGQGTGLGLSTVHGIIKQSGGDIVVYSEVGHGTTFKIYFPCVDENIQRRQWIDSGAKGNVGTETILLVEDEEIVRNLVRTVLKDFGYTVFEAKNGKDALSLCRNYSGPIDLILTDLIMPIMSGTELKREIVKEFPYIKVLFMSGYTDEAISESGLLNSDSHFIEKPFTPDSLARKIRQVLNGDTI